MAGGYLEIAIATAAALGMMQATPTADDPPLAMTATDPALKWGPCPPIFAGDCGIAVLHGDPSQPNADVLLRVGAGVKLPAHQHSSAERMILVRGRLRVRYRGAAARMLAPGDYAFGPAGLPHVAECIGRQPCILFIAFNGPVDALPATGV